MPPKGSATPGPPGSSKPGKALPVRGKNDKSTGTLRASGSTRSGKKLVQSSESDLAPSPIPRVIVTPASNEAGSPKRNKGHSTAIARSAPPARTATIPEVGITTSPQHSGEGKNRPEKLMVRNPAWLHEPGAPKWIPRDHQSVTRARSPTPHTTASEIDSEASQQQSSKGKTGPRKFGVLNKEWPASGPKFYSAGQDPPSSRPKLKIPNVRSVIPFEGPDNLYGSSPSKSEPTPFRGTEPKTKYPFQYDSSTVSVTSSSHSEPLYDRNAKPTWVSKANFDTTKFFNSGEAAARPVSRVALMVRAGQGGTFSYGPKFTDKRPNGRLEEVIVNSALKTGSTKVRHLYSAGEDVDFIGTYGCITCIGIYFELTGNRCFCAHVNAWMSEDPHTASINTGDPAYWDIREQFVKRLQYEADEHGWSKNDFFPSTLLLSAPHQQVLGFAIQDALQEFFDMESRPATAWAHGFMVLPKKPDREGCMQVRWLGVRFKYSDNDPINPEGLLYDPIPSNFSTRRYLDVDGEHMPVQWSYTAGCGWHVYDMDMRLAYIKY